VAYYNTTGVEVRAKVRYCWRDEMGGKLRFNGYGSGFFPDCPFRSLHRVFECDEPAMRTGRLQMFVRRMLPSPARPDFHLFVTTSDQTGLLHCDESWWRSDNVVPFSVSESGDRQELMLLMPAASWIHGELGVFVAEVDPLRPWKARLRLEG
jgi:hypothetical protein